MEIVMCEGYENCMKLQSNILKIIRPLGRLYGWI